MSRGRAAKVDLAQAVAAGQFELPLAEGLQVPVPLPIRVAAAPPPPPPAASPFGQWLLRQERRRDRIGAFALAARADRAFPQHGDPDAVRRRLELVEADPESFELVDEAAREWAAA